MPWIDQNLGITDDDMQNITQIIKYGPLTAMDLEKIINQEISEWQSSEKRKWMQVGERYYRNKTDILERKRTVIGESGAKEPVANLADNKLVNGFVRKLVDQKVGYLLGKPMSVQTEDKTYLKMLNDIFDRNMMRRIKSLGKEAINKGIAWMYVYYDDNGALSFKKMRSEEIIPLWRDEAHTELDAIIRVYEVIVFEGTNQKTVKKVEWWDTNGVRRYVVQNGLVPDVEVGEIDSHFKVIIDGVEKPMNWERVPFIPFKYNEEEQPLVELIKSLVDDYDRNKSDNSNNLEDLPNSIYVVKNYGGTDAAEFRKNISIYRVAFVEGDGGIDTIELKIDTEAYKNHMDSNRKDIYEFGRGVDTQSDKFGGEKSGIALKFLYADLDMDCNILETEFQASLEQLEWFIDTHIYNTTGVDYSDKDVEFIFNRDIPINETEAIRNIKDSIGILSDETLISQHPWVTDVIAELNRIIKQREEEMGQYSGFGAQKTGGEENVEQGNEG